MKKFITLLFIVSLAFATSLSFGQNQTNMYLRGEINSRGTEAMVHSVLDTPKIFTPLLFIFIVKGSHEIFTQTAPVLTSGYGVYSKVAATQQSGSGAPISSGLFVIRGFGQPLRV